MDFGLSEEQELLQYTAREFLKKECTPQLLRETLSKPEPFSDHLHRQMKDLGWLGVLIPETFGGLGLGALESALLLEEMGRASVPGPYLFSSILTAHALVLGGDSSQKHHWLPRIATGDSIGVPALFEATDRLDSAGITTQLQKKKANLVLNGSKMFVPFATLADFFLVSARTAGQQGNNVSLVLVKKDHPGLKIEPLQTFDVTRSLCKLDLTDVPVSGFVGKPDEGWDLITAVQDLACVGLSADSLGGAQQVLEMAVEYTKTREQFGRPIASFQALKHMAAEMISEIEPARSLVWYASYAFDRRATDAPRAASIAKSHLSDVYTKSASKAVQLHGGIGFTWEHDIHFWFKRAKWNESAFGDPTYHRERIARIDKY